MLQKTQCTHHPGQEIEDSRTLEHLWGKLASYYFVWFLASMSMIETGL